MNELFTKLNTELLVDDIGYREWRVEDPTNGDICTLYLRKTVSGWKWSLYESSGTFKDNFSLELKELADKLARHFNETASV